MDISYGHIAHRLVRTCATDEPHAGELSVCGILYRGRHSICSVCPGIPRRNDCKIHATAATVLGICALAWLILTTGCPWIAIIGLCIAVLDCKHFLFWVEAGLLYNLFIDLITIVTLNG